MPIDLPQPALSLAALETPPALMQVGPAPTALPGSVGARPTDTVLPPRRAVPSQPPVQSQKFSECLAAAQADPEVALEGAQAWLATLTGPKRAEAHRCIGNIASLSEDWTAAETAFLAARSDALPTDNAYRARMALLAANAALSRDGGGTAALSALDLAHNDAGSSLDAAFAGTVAVDRARALVLLDRLPEAKVALAEARAAAPSNPTAWLLSATLSRRMGELGPAQAQIEQAAQLLPIDPEIGLEAGVIAVLSGRDSSARRSWQSVIAAAPGTPIAGTAQGYIDQLSAPSTPTGPTTR